MKGLSRFAVPPAIDPVPVRSVRVAVELGMNRRVDDPLHHRHRVLIKQFSIGVVFRHANAVKIRAMRRIIGIEQETDADGSCRPERVAPEPMFHNPVARSFATGKKRRLAAFGALEKHSRESLTQSPD